MINNATWKCYLLFDSKEYNVFIETIFFRQQYASNHHGRSSEDEAERVSSLFVPFFYMQVIKFFKKYRIIVRKIVFTYLCMLC